MFANRLQAYYSSSVSSLAPPTARWPEAPEAPFSPVPLKDIYQAAYERARQDYEINRLFNPEFYEDGSGI